MTGLRTMLLAGVICCWSLTAVAKQQSAAFPHFEAAATAQGILFKGLEHVVAPPSDFEQYAARAAASSLGLTKAREYARAEAGVVSGDIANEDGGQSPEPLVQSGIEDHQQAATRDEGLVQLAAHARRVDLANHRCPAPGSDGQRILSRASVVSGPAENPLGTIATRSQTALTADGDTLAVTSSATAGGELYLSGQLGVRFLSEARLAVVASGVAGGAQMRYLPPVVEIFNPATGAVYGVLDEPGEVLGVPVPGRKSGQIANQFEFTLGEPQNVFLDAQGRYAAAEVAGLYLRSADPVGLYEFADLKLAQLEVSATAPAGGVTGCEGEAVAAAEPEVPHVVIYDRTEGFDHQSTPWLNRMLRDLAVDTGYSFEISRNPNVLRADKLYASDVMLFNNTVGVMPWEEELRGNFEGWLACGGGVVGLHGAADANYDWDAWTEVFLGRFATHPHMGYFPVVGEVTVLVEDQQHPATKPWHGQESFRVADEIYRLDPMPQRGVGFVQVLLALDANSTYPGIQDGLWDYSDYGFGGPAYVDRQPLAWVNSYRGLNRIFYTNLGHNPFVTDRADYRAHVAGGIGWVLEQRPNRGCLAGDDQPGHAQGR